MPGASSRGSGCVWALRRSRPLVVVVVFVALMLDVMMMTSVDPILPDMLARMERGDNATTPADNSTYLSRATEVGVMVAVKPATEMVTNVAVGWLVDRVGHRTPMLVGFLFNFAATVGFAYSTTYVLLSVTRMAQAVGSSLSVVSGLAFLACSFPGDEERARASAQAFSGISLGIIVGYPYGSAVYQFLGREAPFLILAGATLADGALRLLLVSPSNNIQQNRKSCAEICSLLSDVYILIGVGCSFMIHLGLGVFLATGPAWMLDDLHAEQWNIGVVLAVAVIFHFLAQNITGYLAVKVGRWIFCWAGMVIFGAGLATYPLCRTIWAVLGPEIAVRIGHGTCLCVVSPLLAHMADLRHGSQYGAVYGLYTASYNLGLAVGPIIGGTLTRKIPFAWLYWGTGGLVILFSVACVAFRNPRPRKSLAVEAESNNYGSINNHVDNSSSGEEHTISANSPNPLMDPE